MKKEPKGPHVKLIYPKKVAEATARDANFINGNNLKVIWKGAGGQQSAEVHIICTTDHQRKRVIDRIGDPVQELVVKNYLASNINKIPKGCKDALKKAGAMMFPHDEIMQIVFPSREVHASLEKTILGKA